MKLRLLALSIIAISISMLGSSCMTMPTPGGRGHGGHGGPSVSPPSGMHNPGRPSRGGFPRP